jgi:8-oxo-dGTP pyrophosphatase MutT (NUDIX family)
VSPSRDPVDRPAARVVLLDHANRILLFRFRNPDDGREVWITPGGGVEDDETHEEAALRELAEEVGLLDVTLGPEVWRREHPLWFAGQRWIIRERFFVSRIPDSAHHRAIAPGRQDEFVIGHRWWTVQEIEASTAVFAPRRLAQHLRHLLEHGEPTVPIDVGV